MKILVYSSEIKPKDVAKKALWLIPRLFLAWIIGSLTIVLSAGLPFETWWDTFVIFAGIAFFWFPFALLIAVPFNYFILRRGARVEIDEEGICIGRKYWLSKSLEEVASAPLLRFPEGGKNELTIRWGDVDRIEFLYSIESLKPFMGVFRRPRSYFLAVVTKEGNIHSVQTGPVLQKIRDALNSFGKSSLLGEEKRVVLDEVRDPKLQSQLRALKRHLI